MIVVKFGRYVIAAILALVAAVAGYAQADKNQYIRHYGGMYLGEKGGAAQLCAESQAVKYYMTRAYRGYYHIIKEDAGGNRKYLNVGADKKLVFTDDNSTWSSHFAVEKSDGGYSKLKCHADGRYVGVDATRAGTSVLGDKNGNWQNHLWYLSENVGEEPEAMTATYLLNPDAKRQEMEGWGVSLAWWAKEYGTWSNASLNDLIDLLVSPDKLNFNLFRYNIGGGDDPDHANCDEKHLRDNGDIDGFKDSSDGGYIWSRDARQRKVLLKIKELRPDAVYEAFSNSAPYYMTYSGCVAGNEPSGKDNLKPEYYEEFAHYLVDVCKHYKDNYGIEFRTLEPFNESQSDYWGRNGSQEGCHFDISSQISFLKVLDPILKSSGLGTVISAADECWVDGTINSYNGYKDAGVADFVGQWNTHTYNANNNNRSRLNALIRNAGRKLWMSETGLGGDGIIGNLDLAQRLFDDIRYMECEAWLDWQYAAQGGDQWTMVIGNSSTGKVECTKHFYVRQHVTKYIKKGYRIIGTTNDNTIAATNQSGDTLILVALNNKLAKIGHECRLMNCDVAAMPSAFITTQATSMMKTECNYKDGVIKFTLPSRSICTIVIPLNARPAKAMPCEGEYYIIVPQYDKQKALAVTDGKPTLEEVAPTAGWSAVADGEAQSPIAANQTWQAIGDGNGAFRLKNLDGNLLYGTDSYYLSAGKEETLPAEGKSYFRFTPMKNSCYRINPVGDDRVLDLENKSVAAGTSVGLWDAEGVDNCHRNWQLIPVTLSGPSASVEAVTTLPVKISTGRTLLTVSAEGDCNLAVYDLKGICRANVDFNGSVSMPLASGYYIARVTCADGAVTRIVKVD